MVITGVINGKARSYRRHKGMSSRGLGWGKWGMSLEREGGLSFPWGERRCRLLRSRNIWGRGWRKVRKGRGRTLGTPRRQDPGLPANNVRVGEMLRQKESYPFSAWSPSRWSPSLLGSSLSTEAPVMVLIYHGHPANVWMDEWMDEMVGRVCGRKDRWIEGWKDNMLEQESELLVQSYFKIKE